MDPPFRRVGPAVLVLALILGACGSASADVPTTAAATSTTPAGGCADVIDASATPAADGVFTIAATVASADTGWDKYADRWEVRTSDGGVLATRELAHPHETEQPFTRSVNGVVVPVDVERVEIHAHDSVSGFCGQAFELTIDR